MNINKLKITQINPSEPKGTRVKSGGGGDKRTYRQTHTHTFQLIGSIGQTASWVKMLKLSYIFWVTMYGFIFRYWSDWLLPEPSCEPFYFLEYDSQQRHAQDGIGQDCHTATFRRSKSQEKRKKTTYFWYKLVSFFILRTFLLYFCILFYTFTHEQPIIGKAYKNKRMPRRFCQVCS